MRYYGQNYHREIPIAADRCRSPTTTSRAAVEAFHADYEAFYGYAAADELVEIVGVHRHGHRPPARRPGLASSRPRAIERRRRHGPARSTSAPTASATTPILQRDALAAGRDGEGPLIVEEALSTTVVPPGARSLRRARAGASLIDV